MQLATERLASDEGWRRRRRERTILLWACAVAWQIKLEDLKRHGGEAELKLMVSMHTKNEQHPDEFRVREERGRAHGRRGP